MSNVPGTCDVENCKHKYCLHEKCAVATCSYNYGQGTGNASSLDDDLYNNKGNPVFSCPVEVPSVPPYGQSEPVQVQDQEEVHKPVHPMYRTTNTDYGAHPPTIHTVPITFHAKSQEFSNDLGKCGMYRNSSLNTGLDSSNTPDH